MLRVLKVIRILAVRQLAVMAAGLVIFSGAAFPAGGEEARIEIAGLLGDKAVLMINGRQQILQVGETARGIKLVAIAVEGATLEIDGREDYYPLGSAQVSTSYSVREKTTERVYRDGNGMFRTMGSINGYPVNFLVDTGASIVAMNSNEAERLGIRYLLDGQPTTVSTASGNVAAYNIRLDNVAVGQIKLTNVQGVVIEGTHPEIVLLGMSFLGQLNVKNENEVMMLETKY
jgi:aspartyl protease family protein